MFSLFKRVYVIDDHEVIKRWDHRDKYYYWCNRCKKRKDEKTEFHDSFCHDCDCNQCDI